MGRRGWPLAVSTAFVFLGLLYTFQWGPVVQHTPSLWLWPGDLWGASSPRARPSMGMSAARSLARLESWSSLVCW